MPKVPLPHTQDVSKGKVIVQWLELRAKPTFFPPNETLKDDW